ncbi:hypothetical protein V2W45_540357 [Cenococcum geophilum]
MLPLLAPETVCNSSIADAAAARADVFPTPPHHLHLAFVLPGVLFPEKSPAQIDADNALLTLRTNALGPLCSSTSRPSSAEALPHAPAFFLLFFSLSSSAGERVADGLMRCTVFRLSRRRRSCRRASAASPITASAASTATGRPRLL